jgi:hypothetical protein
MNLSKIMIEAHRIARIYRAAMTYRKALAHGLRKAWAFAKGVAEIEAREAARQAKEGPEGTALRSELMAIQTQDRMTAADFAAAAELRRRIDRIAA